MCRTCGSSTFLQDTFQKMLLPIVVNWRQPSRHWFRVEISTEKPPIGLKETGKNVKKMNNEMHIRHFMKPKLHERSSGIESGHEWSEYRVHALFWTKNSRSFQGHISHFFKDSVQCKKEPWVCLFWFFLFYPEGLPVFAPFRHLRMVCANPGNSQNNSLNLVYPRFKRETEGGGGVHLVCG